MADEKMIPYTDEEGNRIAIIGKTKVIYKKMSDMEKIIGSTKNHIFTLKRLTKGKIDCIINMYDIQRL